MSNIPVGNGGFRSWYSKNEQKPAKSVLYEQKYNVHREHMSSRRRGDKENDVDEGGVVGNGGNGCERRRLSSESSPTSIFEPSSDDFARYDRDMRLARYESRDQRVTQRTLSPTSSAAPAHQRAAPPRSSPSARTFAQLDPQNSTLTPVNVGPSQTITPSRHSLNSSDQYFTPETSKRDEHLPGPSERSNTHDSATPTSSRPPRGSISFVGSESDVKMRLLAKRFNQNFENLKIFMNNRIVPDDWPPRLSREAVSRMRSASLSRAPETADPRQRSRSHESISNATYQESEISYVDHVVLAHQMQMSLVNTHQKVIEQYNKVDSIKHMQRLVSTTKSPPGAARRAQIDAETHEKKKTALNELKDRIMKIYRANAKIHRKMFGKEFQFPEEDRQLLFEMGEWIHLPFDEFNDKIARLRVDLTKRMQLASDKNLILKRHDTKAPTTGRRSSLAIKLTPAGFETCQIERKLTVPPTVPPPLPARAPVSRYPMHPLVEEMTPIPVVPVEPRPPAATPNKQSSGTQVTPRLWNTDAETQVTARLAEGAGFVNGPPPSQIEMKTTGTQVTPREPQTQRPKSNVVPALDLSSVSAGAGQPARMSDINDMLNSIQLHDVSLETIEIESHQQPSSSIAKPLPPPSPPVNPLTRGYTVHPNAARRSSLPDGEEPAEKVSTPQTTPRSSIDMSSMSAITLGLLNYVNEQKKKTEEAEKRKVKLEAVEEEEVCEKKAPVHIKVSVVERPIAAQPLALPQPSRIPVLAGRSVQSVNPLNSPKVHRHTLTAAVVKPRISLEARAALSVDQQETASPEVPSHLPIAPRSQIQSAPDVPRPSEDAVVPTILTETLLTSNPPAPNDLNVSVNAPSVASVASSTSSPDAVTPSESAAVPTASIGLPEVSGSSAPNAQDVPLTLTENTPVPLTEEIPEVSPFRRMLGPEESYESDPDAKISPPNELVFPSDDRFSIPSTAPSDLPSGPISEISSQSSGDKNSPEFKYSPLSTDESVISEKMFLMGMHIAVGADIPKIVVITPSNDTPVFSEPPASEYEDEEEEEVTIDLNATEFEHEREEREKEETSTKQDEEASGSEKKNTPEQSLKVVKQSEEKKREVEQEEPIVEELPIEQAQEQSGSEVTFGESDVEAAIEMLADNTADDSGFLLNNEPPPRLASILDNIFPLRPSGPLPSLKNVPAASSQGSSSSALPFLPNAPPAYQEEDPHPPPKRDQQNAALQADTPIRSSRMDQADMTLDLQAVVSSELLSYIGLHMIEKVIVHQEQLRGLDWIRAPQVCPPPTARDLNLDMEDPYETFDSMSVIIWGEVIDFFNQKFGGMNRKMTDDEKKDFEKEALEILEKEHGDDEINEIEFNLNVKISPRLEGINPLFLEYRFDDRKTLPDHIKDEYQMQQIVMKAVDGRYTWLDTEPALGALYEQMKPDSQAEEGFSGKSVIPSSARELSNSSETVPLSNDDSVDDDEKTLRGDDDSIEENLPGTPGAESVDSSEAHDVPGPLPNIANPPGSSDDTSYSDYFVASDEAPTSEEGGRSDEVGFSDL